MSKGKGLFLELEPLRSAQRSIRDNLYLTQKFKGVLKLNKSLDGKDDSKYYEKRKIERKISNSLYQKVDYWKYYKEERKYYADDIFEENEYKFGSQFRTDLARVINSHGFRRLCGKTQLFPARESDFFRNRLTHSLEVAQVAKSIAAKVNIGQKKGKKIDLDLVELAGLAHDIGHPPFGHQGEEILAEKMVEFGGFEGNAQTLRLLTRLEKRIHTGELNREGFAKGEVDRRGGVNLSFRALASVLKYDQDIGRSLSKKGKIENKVVKGYYSSERIIVEKIKKAVAGDYNYKGKFETIECQVMDLADDIAYSTYDLEDAFKAGFMSPGKMLTQEVGFYENIASKVNFNLKSKVTDIENEGIDSEYIRNVLSDLCIFLFNLPEEVIEGIKGLGPDDMSKEEYMIIGHQYAGLYDDLVTDNGYVRSDFSAQLISSSIDGVLLEYNEECPPLSKLTIDKKSRIRIEILKQLAFNTQVLSPRLKANENRGKMIIKTIFETLDFGENENAIPELLPDDFKIIFQQSKDKGHKYRTICDYIACMTDRYAVDFYSRITSARPTSIFVPY